MADQIREWCAGKNWTWRLGIWFFLAYISLRYILQNDYCSFFGGINLGVHEMGHVIFGFAGEAVCIAGGTIVELAAPIICAVMFWRQPDYFALTFSGVWLAAGLYDVAVYAGDAQAMQLPLVSVGGGDVYHDWEYMLSKANLLPYCGQISWFIRALAIVVSLISLVYGAWILWLMARSESNQSKNFL